MKSLLRFLPRAAALVGLALWSAALAQPPAAPEATPPPAAIAPEATPPVPAPEAAPTPPVAVEAPAPQPAPPVAVEASGAKVTTPLRRIDGSDSRGRIDGDDVRFGDRTVREGGRQRSVLTISGTSRVNGEVEDDVVTIRGDTYIGPNAYVNGSAVTILGNLEARGGIRRDSITILGRTMIDSQVGGDLVAILGDVELGPNAVINDDVIVIGGRLNRHPNAIVRGQEVPISAFGFGGMEGLAAWFRECVFYGRMLAFHPRLVWTLALAVAALALYLLLAVLFARPIDLCIETLDTKPGSTLLAAMLSLLIVPLALVLLTVTVVGALFLPFILLGLFFAVLFGKAAMLAWIGRRFTRVFGIAALNHPALGVLIGGLVVLVIYFIPFLGMMVFALLTWLGVGLALYVLLLSVKRERARPAVAAARGAVPPAPTVPPFASASVPPMPVAPFTTEIPVAPVVPYAAPVEAAGVMAAPPAPMFYSAAPEPTRAAAAAVPPVVPVAPRAVPPTTLPRAGFFIRLGAILIDTILVGFAVGFAVELSTRGHGNFMPSAVVLALAAYSAVLWKLKSTSIGGIICGLKVVRLDNREIDWTTAIVRALACFLSLLVFCLGFIWVAFDDERQSWHDKIAGTAVVRMPRGMSLI